MEEDIVETKLDNYIFLIVETGDEYIMIHYAIISLNKIKKQKAKQKQYGL